MAGRSLGQGVWVYCRDCDFCGRTAAAGESYHVRGSFQVSKSQTLKISRRRYEEFSSVVQSSIQTDLHGGRKLAEGPLAFVSQLQGPSD